MAQLLTATLDDVARKRGDLYPITATLRANGAPANLTGATVAVTIVDRITRAPLVLNGSCTVVAPLLGTVSYQPTVDDADYEGTVDVEFKATIGGAASHYPCADYASLRFWPTLDLPPFVPPAAGINDGSVTLAMLALLASRSLIGNPLFASATPQAVALSTLAKAMLADTPIADRALVGIGNTGNVAGRALNPVLIDYAPQFALQTNYAKTWQAGQYKEIRIKVQNVSGTATGFTITLTGLSGTYKLLGIYNASNAPATVAGVGSNTAWSVGMGAAPWKLRGEIDVDGGGYRQASLTTISPNGLGAGIMLSYRLECQHDDLVNDVTGINIAFSGGYITGWVEVEGVPFVAPATTTIMFMGDSITEGGPSGGFRQKIGTELGQYLPKGSLTTDPPLAPFPRSRVQHQGHGGQSSSYFVANIAAIWAANPTAYVTFLIGANDAIAGVAPAVTAANIATVVDYIHAQSPNTFIWVGLVTNATSAQVAWNATLDAQRPLVTALCSSRPWTKAVALPHLSDAQLDASVHPVNAAAYDVVADAWIAEMRQSGAP